MLYYDIGPLLDVLCKTIKDSNDMDNIILDFTNYYLKNHRHKYSEISKYINEKSINDNQIISFLLTNIEKLKKYCDENKEHVSKIIDEIVKKSSFHYDRDRTFDYHELLKKIEKLEDHIELEIQRITFENRREQSNSSNLILSLNKALGTAQYEITQKANEVENRLNTTVISTLGIFSAIVVAFFGGLNIIGNLFSSLKNESRYIIIYAIAIIGIVIFNIIFMLIYFIAKLLDRNIGTGYCPFEYLNTYSVDKLNIFKRIKNDFIRLNRRYPLVLWYNIFMIVTMISISILWIVKK